MSLYFSLRISNMILYIFSQFNDIIIYASHWVQCVEHKLFYKPLTVNLDNLCGVELVNSAYAQLICLEYVLFLMILLLRKSIYKICPHHDIAEILLKLVLNTNQSIIFYLFRKLSNIVFSLFYRLFVNVELKNEILKTS
jgi:hypothetical protein